MGDGGTAAPPAGPPVDLTLKVAGVHWWFRTRSHAAELTAGARPGQAGAVLCYVGASAGWQFAAAAHARVWTSACPPPHVLHFLPPSLPPLRLLQHGPARRIQRHPAALRGESHLGGAAWLAGWLAGWLADWLMRLANSASRSYPESVRCFPPCTLRETPRSSQPHTANTPQSPMPRPPAPCSATAWP